jgi:hypothetical protein
MMGGLVPAVPAVNWELLYAEMPLRMLTSSELARLQGFSPEFVFVYESPPCKAFAVSLTGPSERAK